MRQSVTGTVHGSGPTQVTSMAQEALNSGGLQVENGSRFQGLDEVDEDMDVGAQIDLLKQQISKIQGLGAWRKTKQKKGDSGAVAHESMGQQGGPRVLQSKGRSTKGIVFKDPPTDGKVQPSKPGSSGKLKQPMARPSQT